MHRFLALILFITCITSTVLFAQEEDEEPLPPPKRAGSVKIGGAVGFTQGLLFLNVDPINDIMRRENLAEFSKDGLFLFGGQGYAYIIFVPNLRLGYQGMGGRMKSKTLYQASNTVREVELSISYSCATIDYTIPVVPRLDFSAGLSLGGGTMDLKFTRNSGVGQNWDNTWSEFGSAQPVADYGGKLSGSFFAYQPSVVIEFAILRWLGMRAGVSYLGMAGGDWKRDERYDVYGVPDGVSGKGWTVQSGIFVGTFVF